MRNVILYTIIFISLNSCIGYDSVDTWAQDWLQDQTAWIIIIIIGAIIFLFSNSKDKVNKDK